MNDQAKRAERLRALLAKSGYASVGELARAARKPAATLTGHFNGWRGFRFEMAEFYARRLHSTPEWILFGKELNQANGNAAIKGEVHIVSLPVPLLSCHDIEQFRSIVAGENPMSDKSIPAPPGVMASDRTLAFQITDKAMEGGEKSINQGEYVFVDPMEKYDTGDIVAAIDAPGFNCAIVRRYRITSYDADGKPLFDLAANHPDFPSVIAAHAMNVKIVGKIVGAFRII